MPTVSVIIPSYNHEKFVAECIQSVLHQTFEDFEIIITDDASTDRTVEVIEQFKDQRIKLFKHAVNQGVSVAANNCIHHSSGKYIAWMSSDDVWYPNKLEVQVQYLEGHPGVGVVFGEVDWIDEAGNLITDPQFPYLNIFNAANRPRVEWLQYFFLQGNCLSLPCSLIRRECFLQVGLFDPTYAKIQDLDLWIRICLRYPIAVLDENLIQNRWIGDESNASGKTLKNRIQVQLEHKRSLDHYLAVKDPDELLAIFPDATKYGKPVPKTIPYFLGRIAIDTHLDYKVLWGLDTIASLLQHETVAQHLEQQYNFTFRDFLKLSTECDPFNLLLLADREQTIQTLLAEKEQTAEMLLAEKERAVTMLIQEKEQTAAMLLAEITGYQQTIETLAAQLTGSHQTIEALTNELEKHQQHSQSLAVRLQSVEQELLAIKRSRTWRYTAFLRQFWGK